MKRYIVKTNDICHNVEIIKSTCGCRIIGVIKSGGYGLGLCEMAGVLKKNGIDFYAVTEVTDLKALRKSVLPDEEILVMRSTLSVEEAAEIVKYKGTATVGSIGAAQVLERACKESGKRARIHIKIDTGMSRYGFLPEDTDGIMKACKALENADITGIYTHFSNSFSDDALTESQLARFKSAVKFLNESGIEFETVHAANSAAALKGKGTELGTVRVGSAFLGRAVAPASLGLKRVGILESEIIEIKKIKKGDRVGYLGAFTAKKDMKLGIVPVGNYDGFGMAPISDINDFSVMFYGIMSQIKRFLKKNQIYVNVAGRLCPTVGHIALNHAAVDITGSNISAGDTALLDISPLYLNSGIPRVFED